MLFEKGRVCMKIAGRESGKYCVVVEEGDGELVMVTGPKKLTGVKHRKCNVNHLEPTTEKLEISGTSDEEITQVWENSGLIEKLGLKK
jgi:large subunit ribosomal protein L14e